VDARTWTWGSLRRHSSRATLLSLFHSASAARQRRRPSVASMCAGARGLLAVAAYLRSYASRASSHRFSFSYHDSCVTADGQREHRNSRSRHQRWCTVRSGG